MKDINLWLQKESKKFAEAHDKIIEEECKKAIEKYNCSLDQLIIEVQSHTKTRILIKAYECEIVDIFTYKTGEKNES